MKKYLVCLDIDGTLIGEDLLVSAQDKDALNTMIDNGAIVFLVTGRMLYSAKVIANDISPNVGLIASNGAVIETPQNTVVNGLSEDVIEKLVKLSYQYEFSLFLFGKQKVFYTTTVPEYLQGDGGNRVHSPNIEDYCKLTLLDSKPKESVANGIVIEEKNPDRLVKIRKLLSESFGNILQLSTSNKNNIELIPNGVDKGKAVQFLQNLYKIDRDHTIAFGDGENDLSMLNNSKYSVAMGNASKKVKQSSNYETLDYIHNGVSYFLEKNFLNGVK